MRILRQYGITPESGFDETYDHLAELQLEADEVTAQMLAKLWQYFQFIHGSGEAAELWKLGEQSPPRFRVVERLTTMIARDVEQRRCNLDETFAFMTNRIILYGHYPDTPPDTIAKKIATPKITIRFILRSSTCLKGTFRRNNSSCRQHGNTSQRDGVKSSEVQPSVPCGPANFVLVLPC